MKHPRFTNFSEPPRERLSRSGPKALTLEECLALIIGSGNPRFSLETIISALKRADESETDWFARWNDADWSEAIPGLGTAGQARMLAVREIAQRYLGYRIQTRAPNSVSASDLEVQSLKQIPTELRLQETEWFGFIPVHTDGSMGKLCVVEKGTRTHVNLDPVRLFYEILRRHPRAIILVHNHPSNDVSPSSSDRHLTRKVSVLASEFTILVLGHWIVGPTESFLLKEKARIHAVEAADEE